MTLDQYLQSPKLVNVLNKASSTSTSTHYNPYLLFDWVPEISESRLWMSRDLLTVHGSVFEREWPEEVLFRLSKWESIHFYSLNIHGERELLSEIVQRIHTHAFAQRPSEFFHHFIDEENAHVWFFAKFCLDYGGKIYPDRRVQLSKESSPEVEEFVVFAKILIFEELVDYYNRRIASDEALPDLVRELNRVHHVDESRHIACSRELVAATYAALREKSEPEALREIERYLQGYMQVCVESLYNPLAYADARVPMSPYELRRALLDDPARKQKHDDILRRTRGFLQKAGIFSSNEAVT